MEEERENEVKVNDGSYGSPVSEQTSANVGAQELAFQENWKISIFQSSGLIAEGVAIFKSD
jgi:hypothetical protein